MRRWFSAAFGLAALLLFVGSANAGQVVYKLLKADTLYTHCADSTTSPRGAQTLPYIDTERFARMWVNFIGTTLVSDHASADADTVAYNTIAPAYGTPGSNEWRVVLNPAVTSAEVGDGVLRRWTARLELVNVMTGLPYRGKWTSIKWR
jgi:hypothetical protein